MPRPALANVSIAALKKEIERRTAKLDALKAQRDALDRQIAELEGLTGEAPKKRGRKPGRRPGRRPGRKATKRPTGKRLAEYVKDALAKVPKGLSVKDIEKAVLAAGYPTKAKTIYNPVMKVLAKGDYRKVGRGVYGVRGRPGRKPGKKPAAPAATEAKAPRKRKKYAQTAGQFVLALVQGKGATTAEINKAWKDAERVGRADNTLNKMLGAGKLKREKLKGQKGSMYTVA